MKWTLSACVVRDQPEPGLMSAAQCSVGWRRTTGGMWRLRKYKQRGGGGVLRLLPVSTRVSCLLSAQLKYTSLSSMEFIWIQNGYMRFHKLSYLELPKASTSFYQFPLDYFCLMQGLSKLKQCDLLIIGYSYYETTLNFVIALKTFHSKINKYMSVQELRSTSKLFRSSKKSKT